MENKTKFSQIAFIKNIKYNWSVETVADFLTNKLPQLDIHADTWNRQRKTALELLVGDSTRHSSRDKSVMCLLLKHGACPLEKARGGGTIIQKILQNKDSALIIKFLEHVKDINMLHGGSTALHIAVRRQLKDVVDYIIGRNPDMNKKSDSQSTPLHEAVRCERVDITKILLDNGADIEARDRTGQTPLHWALGYTDSFDQVRFLVINGADVNSRDEFARTPLHTLCSRGLRINFDTFELLLQKVSDINAADITGAVPLHKLMRFSSVDSASEKETLIDLFLQYGGNLNKQDHFSDSVLHAAAFFNQSVSFLRFLIEKGADTSIRNGLGETFITSMIRSSRTKVEELLRCLFVEECRNKFKFNDYLLYSIRTDKQICEFEASCREELSSLKEEKLKKDDCLTLFTVMTVNERALARFFRNDPSRIGVIAFERFPIYGIDLKQNYEIGLKRFKAEISVCNFLTEISEGILDRDSIDEILKFLSTEEISLFQ